MYCVRSVGRLPGHASVPVHLERKPEQAMTQKFTVLALDLGTATGWALRQRDGTTTSGTQHFKPQRFEGGGMRFLRFKRWLTELRAAAGDIGAVYFEEVRRHTGVDAAHVYGGLMAHLTAWCEQHQVPYQGVPVGAIKRHVAGRGNAGKGGGGRCGEKTRLRAFGR